MPGRGRVGAAAGRCGRARLSQKVESWCIRDRSGKASRGARGPQRLRGLLLMAPKPQPHGICFSAPVEVVKHVHGFFHTLPSKTWRLRPSPLHLGLCERRGTGAAGPPR